MEHSIKLWDNNLINANVSQNISLLPFLNVLLFKWQGLSQTGCIISFVISNN